MRLYSTGGSRHVVLPFHKLKSMHGGRIFLPINIGAGFKMISSDIKEPIPDMSKLTNSLTRLHIRDGVPKKRKYINFKA